MAKTGQRAGGSLYIWIIFKHPPSELDGRRKKKNFIDLLQVFKQNKKQKLHTLDLVSCDL